VTGYLGRIVARASGRAAPSEVRPRPSGWFRTGLLDADVVSVPEIGAEATASRSVLRTETGAAAIRTAPGLSVSDSARPLPVQRAHTVSANVVPARGVESAPAQILGPGAAPVPRSRFFPDEKTRPPTAASDNPTTLRPVSVDANQARLDDTKPESSRARREPEHQDVAREAGPLSVKRAVTASGATGVFEPSEASGPARTCREPDGTNVRSTGRLGNEFEPPGTAGSVWKRAEDVRTDTAYPRPDMTASAEKTNEDALSGDTPAVGEPKPGPRVDDAAPEATVVLQPPMPRHGTPTRTHAESATPKLVIGSLKVEVVPPAEAPETIVREVVRQVPAAAPSAPGPTSKLRFGIGQM